MENGAEGRWREDRGYVGRGSGEGMTRTVKDLHWYSLQIPEDHEDSRRVTPTKSNLEGGGGPQGCRTPGDWEVCTKESPGFHPLGSRPSTVLSEQRHFRGSEILEEDLAGEGLGSLNWLSLWKPLDIQHFICFQFLYESSSRLWGERLLSDVIRKQLQN